MYGYTYFCDYRYCFADNNDSPHIWNEYWTENTERAEYIEKGMNDSSIDFTLNDEIMKFEGKTAYCVDINTNFKKGYKTSAASSSHMSVD